VPSLRSFPNFRSIVIALAAATALSVAPASSASAATTPAPPQGVYEGCASPNLRTTCVDRLQHMKNMGFTVVLNYTALWASGDDLKAYMAAAERIGVKIIWSFKERSWWNADPATNQFGLLAKSCACTTDDALLRYVIGLVKSSPATWGYYIGDESPTTDAPYINGFGNRIKSLDPTHPRLFVGIGDGSGVDTHIAPFAGGSDVLAADYYPVGQDRPISRVLDISRKMADLARTKGKQAGMVLQSFNWSVYGSFPFLVNPHWPTRAEMRQMRDYAIQGGASSLILWFNYYKMADQVNSAQLFGDLAWAANGDSGLTTAPATTTTTAEAGGATTTAGSAGSGTTTTTQQPAVQPPVKPSASTPATTTAPAAAPATTTQADTGSLTTRTTFTALPNVPDVTISPRTAKVTTRGIRLADIRCAKACTLKLRFAAGQSRFADQRLQLRANAAAGVVLRGKARALTALSRRRAKVTVDVVGRVGGRQHRTSFTAGPVAAGTAT
jgi:hypothetical protein